MIFLVDTSVWSLAFRRDAESSAPVVAVLRAALVSATQVVTAGIIVQELLQGFSGPKDRAALIERLSALLFLEPTRDDYVEAAEVHNSCRRRGVQVGTIDALLIALAIRHEATILSTDPDFRHASKHVKFGLWSQ